MGLYSYDIVVAKASGVTVTATMASQPSYAVDSVRLVARPVFRSVATVNGVQYSPGAALVSATGGTVTSTIPYIVDGATTATVSATTITGTYYSASTTAVFVVPFGSTFDSGTTEYQAGGSPRDYGYTASFISTSGGVTAVADSIVAGKIQVTIESAARVPVGGPTTYKAISVTQV